MGEASRIDDPSLLKRPKNSCDADHLSSFIVSDGSVQSSEGALLKLSFCSGERNREIQLWGCNIDCRGRRALRGNGPTELQKRRNRNETDQTQENQRLSH